MYYLTGYYLTDSEISRESFQKNFQFIDQVIPTWLQVKSDGSLQENYSKAEGELLSEYKEKRAIIPLLQNYNMSSAVSNNLVTNLDSQMRLIGDLLRYLENTGLTGINLDLEGVMIENKINFTDFIERLISELHDRDYQLGLSIPAKTENNTDSSWSGAYEYELLGQLVDEIIIMAYDYHWSGGTPGPIAPIKWVQDVIDFAIIEIPLDKIYLGIPLYGYDWLVESDTRARGLSYSQVKALAEKYNCQLEWDQESESPYYIYKDHQGEHEVWFENSKSIIKKLNLVEEFQLQGAAFWRLGLEDEKIWDFFGEV